MALSANHSISPAAVTLRPIGEDDATILLEIYASSRTEELARVQWDEAQKEHFLRMQFEAQRHFYESRYPGAEFKLILVEGRTAGRLYVHRREREIRIMDLTLLPEYRGCGLGTMLLTGIFDEGSRTGRSVTIHVESFNRAKQLYERLGFVNVASNGVHHLMEWNPSRPSVPPFLVAEGSSSEH